MNRYMPSLLLEPELPADDVLANAVDFCSVKLGVSSDAVHRALAAGESTVHSLVRYAVAKQLARYLGGLSSGFRGIYLYGSTMNDSAEASSDIDLLVVVEQKTDQASALLLRLDDALVGSFHRLLDCSICPISLLDVHLVDIEEAHRCRGYGSVLSSIEASPVCLWR